MQRASGPGDDPPSLPPTDPADGAAAARVTQPAAEPEGPAPEPGTPPAGPPPPPADPWAWPRAPAGPPPPPADPWAWPRAPAGPPPPPEAHPGPSIAIGAIVGATVDTYAATLGRVLPVAAAYGLVYVLVPGESAWSLVNSVIWALAAAYVIRVAGGHLRGSSEELGDLLGATVRRAGWLVLWSWLVGLAVGVIGVLIGIAVAIAALSLGPPGIAVGAIVALVGGVAGLALLARWAVAPAVIVLDGQGPLAASGQSAGLVRGQTARVMVLAVLVGVASLVPSLAAFLPLAMPEVDARVTAVVVGAIVGVAFPLLPIAFTVLLVRLDGSGAPVGEPSTWRTVVVGAVVVASLALGAAIAVTGGVRLAEQVGAMEAARGTIAFGTTTQACAVSDARDTFTAGEEIAVAAVLSRPLAVGEDLTIHVQLNGIVIGVETVRPDEAGECFGGSLPTDGWPVGRYRFEYRVGEHLLAAGEFDLVAP